MNMQEKSAKEGNNSFSWKAIFQSYGCCGGDRDDLSVSSTDSNKPKTKPHTRKKTSLKYKKLGRAPIRRDENKSAASSTHWTDLEDIKLPCDPNIRLSSAYPSHEIKESGIDIEDYLTQEPIDFESLKKITQREKEMHEEKSAISALTINSKKIHREEPTNNNKKYKINPKDSTNKSKRIPWQPHEDSQVIEFVTKYGPKWAKIAQLLPGRTGKQVRDRYTNKLKPNINKEEWTKEEEELFASLCQKLGHRWSKIASHLPGRTEGQVKNRYYAQFRKKNQKSDENDQTSVSVSDGLYSMEHSGEVIAPKGIEGITFNMKTQEPVPYQNILGYELQGYMQKCIAEGRDQIQEMRNSYKNSYADTGTFSEEVQMNDPTSVISYDGGMIAKDQQMDTREDYPLNFKFNPLPYQMMEMNPIPFTSSTSLNQTMPNNLNEYSNSSDLQKISPSRGNSYPSEPKSSEEKGLISSSNHCCSGADVLNQCDKLSKRMDTLEFLLVNILHDMKEMKFRDNRSNPP